MSTCSTCRHSHQGQQAGAQALFCRRFPPTLIVRDQPPVHLKGFREPQQGGMAMFGWFPAVPPEGTCGEHAAAPEGVQ